MNLRRAESHPWMLLLLVLAGSLSTICAAKAAPPVHKKPALDLFVYRRSQTPDEKIKLRLSAFNQFAIDFTAYRLDLRRLVTSSRSLKDLPKSLKSLPLTGLGVVRRWRYPMGKTYPDQWAEREVTVPKLSPGVYLVRATGGGAERRTWLAVTDIALLSKRSPQEALVYAASVHSGRPIANLQLNLIDGAGKSVHGSTDSSGVWRTQYAGTGAGKDSALWYYGERNGSPAFLLAGAPPPAPAFTVYTYTDRPIYRPGHTIQYRGTVRQRLESDAPGGFTYRPYAAQDVTVEVRDSTDALIDRKSLKTNRFGTFDSSFQLSAEPPLGRWQLITIVGGQRNYAAVEVQAYRKPEYTVAVQMPSGHVVGGGPVAVTIEGRYFFGQPVANAAVQYQIQFAAESSAGQGAAAAPEPPFNGQGVLDSKGRLQLEVQTKRLPINRTMTVSATVTDLSRRSQQASGAMLLTAGQFHVSLATEKSFYHAGERVAVIVNAADYDDRPVAARVRVRLIETKEDSKHRPYKETTTRDIVTDAAGRGIAYFQPPRPGYMELTAEAFDAADNKIAASASVWIAGDEIAGYDYPTLDLVADRTSYRPGETANVLINTSLVTPPTKHKPKPSKPRQNDDSDEVHPEYPEAWALVTVQGERLYNYRMVRLTSRTSSIRVPLIDRYFPSVQVSVAVIQEKHIYEQDLRLEVARDDQKLSVKIDADKSAYSPGEAAVYTVTTKDYRGRPVSAELGVGVVDAAVYAVKPDDTPDPESFFYSGQEVRVHTDFSFAAQYSGGAAQTVPHAPAESPATPPPTGAIRVRKQFADTAVWLPTVITDENGSAKVSCTLPDNLTTWRATARAISAQTAVGTATHDVVSSLPLLVRLSLPRFYVSGDEAIISAIVHNYTGSARTVHARIEVEGAVTEGPSERDLEVAANGEQRLDWKARISAGAVQAGAVRIRMTADGGQGGQDATELTLPVSRDGFAQVDVRANVLNNDMSTQQVDLTALPRDATITVTLAPSIASATFDALDFLTSYPYGCAEQTMSAFLPDIAVAGTIKRLGSSRKVHPDLQKWVNLGLQKLYRYQHSDGGWNWWEFDQTDGDMTSYVLWGLVQAKEAGYLVDEQRILRGTEALIRLLRDEREWNTRADWILTLAYARPEAITKAAFGKPLSPLAELFQNRSKLDTTSLASLCLALNKAGAAADAATVAGELEARAQVVGTTAHWPAADGGYTWRSDDAGVTARALRALISVRSASPMIPPAVRWLMGNRVGKAWGSTRSSAEVVFALAQYMEQTGELKNGVNSRVLLDGQAVAEQNWTPSQAFDDPIRTVLPPDRWQGRSKLEIVKPGGGTLYSTVRIDYTVPAESAKATGKGIAVRRVYHVSAEDPSHADTISSGEDVEVTVDVTADANYKYAMLEEPIPAGCEVAPPDETFRPWGLAFENGTGYVRQEVRDNRVVFFFSDLPKGKATFTYRLHAETPGIYRILPSIASLVYFPEIRANSAPARARIGER